MLKHPGPRAVRRCSLGPSPRVCSVLSGMYVTSPPDSNLWTVFSAPFVSLPAAGHICEPLRDRKGLLHKDPELQLPEVSAHAWLNP